MIYVPKLQKQSNSYQVASIWRQNDQKCWVTSQNILNNAKLQNWSNYNELHRFDVKTVKNRKTTKAIKLRLICIDLTSKRSKMLSYVAKHSKQRKTTKLVKLQWIWFDVKTIKTTQNYNTDQITMNCIDLTSKRSKMLSNVAKQITQNYKSDQITMNCIDLTSKRSKMLSYVAKHSKQRKTTKLVKLQWIASIWCQNGQNIAKLQNWSNYMNCIDLMSKRFASIWFYVKTIKNVELLANLSKQRKTTKVIKLQWIASIWCQKHQTNAKLQKWSYFDEFASIWRQNDQNNAKLQNWSNYNELHRFDVKTVKNRKTTKGIKLRSICIDLTSKRSKMLSNVAKHSEQRKTTKLIKLLWIASIWRQNDLKSWVTSQNYKSDQIITNCIDLTSKRSKLLS